MQMKRTFYITILLKLQKQFTIVNLEIEIDVSTEIQEETLAIIGKFQELIINKSIIRALYLKDVLLIVWSLGQN